MDESRENNEERQVASNPSTSKWQSIPADLLYIFTDLYLTDEEYGDPQLLTHVCHHWRSILMSKTSLWSKITIAHPTVYPNQRRVWGSEICHTPAELERALERTNGGYIDLSCWFDLYEPDSALGNDTPQGLIDVIRASQSFLRIHRLMIDSDSRELMEEIDFDGWEFPALEQAVLTTISSKLKKQIERTAPRLQHLCLHGSDGSHLDWDLSAMTMPFTLELMGRSEEIHQNLRLRQMLSSIRHIVSMSLWDLIVPGSEPLSLPTLQTMELFSTRLEFNIDCPSLQRLHLYESFIQASRSNPFVSSSLKSLEFSNQGARDLLHIHVGCLETLKFSTSPTPDLLFIQTFFEQMVKPGYVRPTNLQLLYLRIDLSLLTSILREVPYLVELFMGDCNVRIQFFEAFSGCSLPAEPDSPRQQPILPSLKIFKLQVLSASPSSRYAMDMTNWLTWAVDARSKGGYPLKAAIRYRNGTSWVDV